MAIKNETDVLIDQKNKNKILIDEFRRSGMLRFTDWLDQRDDNKKIKIHAFCKKIKKQYPHFNKSVTCQFEQEILPLINYDKLMQMGFESIEFGLNSNDITSYPSEQMNS